MSCDINPTLKFVCFKTHPLGSVPPWEVDDRPWGMRAGLKLPIDMRMLCFLWKRLKWWCLVPWARFRKFSTKKRWCAWGRDVDIFSGKKWCYSRGKVDDVVLREELMGFPKGRRHHSWGEMMWLLGKRWWSFLSSREGGIQWGPKRRVVRFGKPSSRKPIQQGRDVAKEEGWRGEVEKVWVVGKEQVGRDSRWVLDYSGNVEERGGFG